MKRFTISLIVLIVSLAFLGSPSVLEARGGFGGHGGWGGGPHAGFHGGFHSAFHGGFHDGFHGGFHRGFHRGFHDRFFFGFGVGFWPDPFFWGPPVVGWPYYPAVVTVTSPVYTAPAQQPRYYWYYCQDPKGYFPYVGSCPGGWIPVEPNVTPPGQ